MSVKILSNSSVIKLKAEMVVTTCFVMPANEMKGMMHIKRDPGSNPACGKKNFWLKYLRSFDIPVKRISIMTLTSIFLEKDVVTKKVQQLVGFIS